MLEAGLSPCDVLDLCANTGEVKFCHCLLWWHQFRSGDGCTDTSQPSQGIDIREPSPPSCMYITCYLPCISWIVFTSPDLESSGDDDIEYCRPKRIKYAHHACAYYVTVLLCQMGHSIIIIQGVDKARSYHWGSNNWERCPSRGSTGRDCWERCICHRIHPQRLLALWL